MSKKISDNFLALLFFISLAILIWIIFDDREKINFEKAKAEYNYTVIYNDGKKKTLKLESNDILYIAYENNNYAVLECEDKFFKLIIGEVIEFKEL